MNGGLTWRQVAILLTISALVGGAVWGATTTFVFRSDYDVDQARIETALERIDVKLDRLLRRNP